MVYLFVGPPTPEKNQSVTDLKDKLLPSKDSVQFDYQALDGHKLEPSELKQALMALPAMSKKRLVMIRSVSKLSKQNQDLLSSLLDDNLDHVDIILDTVSIDGRSGLFKKLQKQAKVKTFEEKEEVNVFAITNRIPNDPAGALKIMDQLMKDGQHPLQLIPGLIWFWGNKMRMRVSKENFKKGLLEFQAADLNIKRSRIKAEAAMEVLVLKLCSLASY